jgi:FkbM family methyltransferase
VNWQRIISKLTACNYIFNAKARPSFAQVGEDAILMYLFKQIGKQTIEYLDVGTNDPVHGNNTYAFYLAGSRGVCVEPDPTLCRKIRKHRPKDRCLNVGIGLNEQDQADFYVFDNDGWNTFSAEEAELRKAGGTPYREVLSIPLRNINQIIATNFQQTPDLISIDVEGLDFDILRSLDFDRWNPAVLVVETLRFGATEQAMKHRDMIDFVLSKGYSIYADTYVNTIFIRTNLLHT